MNREDPRRTDPVVDRSWYYFFTHQTGGRLLLLLLVVGILLLIAGLATGFIG